MSITIYTYSDPYNLSGEPYWEEIKSCPYFCASQTLVNGLKAIYNDDFLQGRVTTVQNLLEAIYPKWESTNAMVPMTVIFFFDVAFFLLFYVVCTSIIQIRDSSLADS